MEAHIPRAELDHLRASASLANCLHRCSRFTEAKVFIRKQLSVARPKFGSDHVMSLEFAEGLCGTIRMDKASSRGELQEALALLEDLLERRMRLCGASHPQTQWIMRELEKVRTRLAFGLYPKG